MKSNRTPKTTDAKRPYRQGARAEAAARTADAIARVFRTFLETEWYDDISLERIAAASNVTVPTILRHFGSKEGILEGVQKHVESEVMARRTVAPGNVDGAIAVVVDDYEVAGDMVLRFLGQEDRVPAIRTVTDFGRASHRDWVAQVFQPFLEGLGPDERAWRLDCLSAALDIYVWKLLRRDRGRSAEEVRAFMKSLVCSMTGPTDGA